MARKKIWQEILAMPEGKQFLAGTMTAIVALVAAVVFLFFKLESNRVWYLDKIEQKDKKIEVVNEVFLKFVIEANERGENTRQKMDSMNLEILNFKRWKENQ